MQCFPVSLLVIGYHISNGKELIIGEKNKQKILKILSILLKCSCKLVLFFYISSDSETNSSLGLVGMALAGFTENKDALWQKMCSSFRQQLTNPYLRAMFFFLSSPQNDNYMDVLVSSKSPTDLPLLKFILTDRTFIFK